MRITKLLLIVIFAVLVFPLLSQVPDSLVFVKGGNFMMGSKDGGADEDPPHKVSVSSFYISKYEVTQREWEELMSQNRSYNKGPDNPVEKVSWYEAVNFCNRLSLKHGLQPCYVIQGIDVKCDFTKNGYRLPTEAEWEYAARGGHLMKDTPYSGDSKVEKVAWYASNANKLTNTPGQKIPNELGLYDMSGNVWEWCWDWYHDNYYNKSETRNPKGVDNGAYAPSGSSYKVRRGGSWNYGSDGCRISFRYMGVPSFRSYDIGFRVVRSAIED